MIINTTSRQWIGWYHYLCQASAIPLVGGESDQGRKFLPILRIFNSTELEHIIIDLFDLFELLFLIILKTCKGLNQVAGNDRLELFEELGRLQGFARNVEGKILSCWEADISLSSMISHVEKVLTVYDYLDPTSPLGERIITKVIGDEYTLDHQPHIF